MAYPDVGKSASGSEHTKVGEEGRRRGKRKKPQPSDEPAPKRRTRASLVADELSRADGSTNINEHPDTIETNEGGKLNVNAAILLYSIIICLIFNVFA